MKTQTFARLSLVIPLLVWVFGLLPWVSAAAFSRDDLPSDPPSIVSTIAGGLLMFYVIGILFWLIPYLLLALILLLLSFKSSIKTLKYAYMLSPIGMALLIMIEVTLILLTPFNSTSLLSDLMAGLQDSLEAGALSGAISLVWGYICVGLGFGAYKLLQHLNIIKDEITPDSAPLLTNCL